MTKGNAKSALMGADIPERDSEQGRKLTTEDISAQASVDWAIDQKRGADPASSVPLVIPGELTPEEIEQLRQRKREVIDLAVKAFPKGWANKHN